ncbi:MAG: PAS domain-containing sensor histidine kinase [Chloroflexota bacterium]
MRGEHKIKGQLVIKSAELRRQVAGLEHALRQAEEDSAQALVRFTDLEARKALESQSRLFAESIVQTVKGPLLVLDEWLRVKTANRAFCDTFQVAAENTEGRLLYELGNGQWNLPVLRTLLERIVPENAQFQDFQVEHDFPTIGRRTMVLNARQIRWNGDTPFILLAIEDITERLRSELALRRMLAANEQMALANLLEREFADAIVSSMAEGVIVYGGRGEVISTNAAARKMLGLAESDAGLSSVEFDRLLLLSTPEGKTLAPDDLPVARALRGENVLGRELALRRPEKGIVWVSVSAAPIYAPNGDPWGAVMAFADITALHELQEQRDDVMRAVSHDLRNPLTVVLGQAQVMVRLLKSTEDSRLTHSAESILASARRMALMIQDLTDSLQLESGQLVLRKQPVDLRTLTAELLARSAQAMEVERVRLEFPDSLPQVEADPQRLERILTNLISNALKYSASESEVLLGAQALDGEVSVSVSDRGRGIASEDLPHIFERFHKMRDERRGGGLGLGLSITKKLVEVHGGRILVQSKVNEGTIFTFILPLEG